MRSTDCGSYGNEYSESGQMIRSWYESCYEDSCTSTMCTYSYYSSGSMHTYDCGMYGSEYDEHGFQVSSWYLSCGEKCENDVCSQVCSRVEQAYHPCNSSYWENGQIQSYECDQYGYEYSSEGVMVSSWYSSCDLWGINGCVNYSRCNVSYNDAGLTNEVACPNYHAVYDSSGQVTQQDWKSCYESECKEYSCSYSYDAMNALENVDCGNWGSTYENGVMVSSWWNHCDNDTCTRQTCSYTFYDSGMTHTMDCGDWSSVYGTNGQVETSTYTSCDGDACTLTTCSYSYFEGGFQIHEIDCGDYGYVYDINGQYTEYWSCSIDSSTTEKICSTSYGEDKEPVDELLNIIERVTLPPIPDFNPPEVIFDNFTAPAETGSEPIEMKTDNSTTGGEFENSTQAEETSQNGVMHGMACEMDADCFYPCGNLLQATTRGCNENGICECNDIGTLFTSQKCKDEIATSFAEFDNGNNPDTTQYDTLSFIGSQWKEMMMNIAVNGYFDCLKTDGECDEFIAAAKRSCNDLEWSFCTGQTMYEGNSLAVPLCYPVSCASELQPVANYLAKEYAVSGGTCSSASELDGSSGALLDSSVTMTFIMLLLLKLI